MSEDGRLPGLLWENLSFRASSGSRILRSSLGLVSAHHPGRSVGSDICENLDSIFAGPVIHDLAVLYLVHVDRIPTDAAVGCGETQEIALVGALDHQANYDSVIFDNDVLFRRSYVRQTAHNRCKESCNVLRSFNGTEISPVPFSLRIKEFHSPIRAMIIEHRSHEPSDKFFVGLFNLGLTL